ncbi:MAG: hypothetical protein ACLPGW_01910 [Roseiarcus sp.]
MRPRGETNRVAPQGGEDRGVVGARQAVGRAGRERFVALALAIHRAERGVGGRRVVRRLGRAERFGSGGEARVRRAERLAARAIELRSGALDKRTCGGRGLSQRAAGAADHGVCAAAPWPSGDAGAHRLEDSFA